MSGGIDIAPHRTKATSPSAVDYLPPPPAIKLTVNFDSKYQVFMAGDDQRFVLPDGASIVSTHKGHTRSDWPVVIRVDTSHVTPTAPKTVGILAKAHMPKGSTEEFAPQLSCEALMPPSPPPLPLPPPSMKPKPPPSPSPLPPPSPRPLPPPNPQPSPPPAAPPPAVPPPTAPPPAAGGGAVLGVVIVLALLAAGGGYAFKLKFPHIWARLLNRLRGFRKADGDDDPWSSEEEGDDGSDGGSSPESGSDDDEAAAAKAKAGSATDSASDGEEEAPPAPEAAQKKEKKKGRPMPGGGGEEAGRLIEVEDDLPMEDDDLDSVLLGSMIGGPAKAKAAQRRAEAGRKMAADAARELSELGAESSAAVRSAMYAAYAADASTEMTAACTKAAAEVAPTLNVHLDPPPPAPPAPPPASDAGSGGGGTKTTLKVHIELPDGTLSALRLKRSTVGGRDELIEVVAQHAEEKGQPMKKKALRELLLQYSPGDDKLALRNLPDDADAALIASASAVYVSKPVAPPPKEEKKQKKSKEKKGKGKDSRK